MALMQPWTLSPIIKLCWLGWQTDTYRMNSYGWDWVVERNEYEQSFIVFANHERDNLKAISDSIDVEFMLMRCKGNRQMEPIGPIEMRMVKTIEVDRNMILQPVSMRPMIVPEENVANQMIEFCSIDNFFVTEKWIRDRISEENRQKITLKPETMKRRLDIPNGH